MYATVGVLLSYTAACWSLGQPTPSNMAATPLADDSVRGRVVVDTQGVTPQHAIRVTLLRSTEDPSEAIASAWFPGPTFAFGAVPAGDYLLEAARVGYEPTRMPVRLPLVGAVEVLVPLYWLPILLDHSPAATTVIGRVRCLASDGVLPPQLTISSGRPDRQSRHSDVGPDGLFTLSGLTRETRWFLEVHAEGRIVGGRSISLEQAYLLKTVTVFIAC